MDGLAQGLILSGRFRLIRRLGEGGMGEVWLADDEELAEPVAVKILNSRLSASAEFVDLLRQECSKARRLVHPNIVRVYDFHKDDEWYFISMQYIEGDNLGALRGAGYREILRNVLMVADALEYAHREGIVHRDIKPSNVLRDRAGTCYLADFGVAGAIAIAGDKQPGTVRGGGSLPAMSPQQLAEHAPAIADDIYSFGALLYELLAGQALFHPDVSAERICQEIPAPLEYDRSGEPLPDPLVKLLAAMLEKSPGRRPAGIGSVRTVLEELLTDYDHAPASPSRENRPGVIRPVPRHTGTPVRPRQADRPAGSRKTAAPVPTRPTSRW
jgi:serine/threonine protein kinase